MQFLSCLRSSGVNSLRLFLACAASLLLAVSLSARSPQNAPPDQQASACGSQTYCFDTPHFVATVTSFRTSTVNGYKLIDTSLRFQNKIDRPVILGYVVSSGFATDDRGNRSAVGGPNGFRGIGWVNGSNFEPKFILRPGGSGEAQFELVLQGNPQIVGFHYVLDVTVAEIKTLEGNQHVLDGEFPLHFEGLANGVSQGMGGLAGAPGAANAISNLKSMFGKKKAVQQVSTVANTASSTAATVSAAANSATAPPATASTANAAPPQTAQSGAASSPNTAYAPNGTAGSAAPATPQNLSPQERIAEPGPASPAQSPQQQPRVNPSQADLRGASLSESDPDPNLGTAKAAASTGKYDVVGIKLGMPAKDALAILKSHGQFQVVPETIKYDFLPSPLTYGLAAANAVVVRNGGHALPESEKVYLLLTMPPNQPVVSKVSRYLLFTKDTAPEQNSLVADLTKKYGPPSYDSHPKDLYYTGYRELFWVDDAQGHRLLNQAESGGGYSNQINNCRGVSTFSFPNTNPSDPNIQVDSGRIKQELEQGYTTQYPAMYGCANLTVIYAKIMYGYPIGVSSRDVAGGLVVVMGSAPLDHTAADATHDYLLQAAKNRDLAQKQKAQKNKPVL